MSAKIRVDLSTAKRCAKLGCKRPGPYHRHHIRHKKYWINRFEHRDIPFSDDFESFARVLKVRYHQWLERDLVTLCEYHHVEVHAIYTRINHQVIRANRLKKITPRIAAGAMRECKQALRAWLGKKTKGMSPRRAGWRRQQP